MKYIRLKGDDELVSLLNGAKCEIITTSNYGWRTNAMKAYIRFYLSEEKLTTANDEHERKLRHYCYKVMPRDAGYDIDGISFEPKFLLEDEGSSLEDELENISGELSQEVLSDIIPLDIKNKGREMTEVYLFLYCVENSLRLFIEKVAMDKLGDDYFNHLHIKKSIHDKISIRKREEKKDKWLRLRGDSDVFYLDFDDLGNIIGNNWDIFKEFFPRLDWIVPKIKEMAKIRNLVAHNSYIESSGKELVRTYFKVILKQINDVLEGGNK